MYKAILKRYLGRFENLISIHQKNKNKKEKINLF
jgi:hypothetical protein